MSVITAASPATSHQSSSTSSPAGRRGWFATVRRELQRRRYRNARRAHERQDLTDAYLDRHGTAQLDTTSAAALMRR